VSDSGLLLRWCAVVSQEYCLDCGSHLSSSDRHSRHRRCLTCRQKRREPSTPLPSSPSLPPSSHLSPLFGRESSVGHPLSSIERAAAVTLTRIGETQQQTAERIGCTRQTVSHWQHTFVETGEVKDAVRSGRPRQTSELEDETIVVSAVVDPHLTPRAVKQEVQTDASPHTVSRRLDEAVLFGRVAQRKRKFTDEDRRKRLSFAEGYKNWKEEQWESVVFADEALIEGAGGSGGGRQWVRRPPGEQEIFKPEYTVDKQPHPTKLGVWACFSGRGLGYSYIYNAKMDAKHLKHVLDIHLLPSARLLFHQHPPEHWWLLQDNAPTHTATLVQQWLHNHGISLLDFPPYSPDLNPIENLWNDVEKRVERRAPTTIEELQDVIAEEWAATPTELLKTLAHSMPKRCQAVIDAHGDHTRF
jgi:transposase